jgi:putative DNA primase/helicase
MNAPAAQFRDLTRDEIRDALSYLNASDRDEWVFAAFAIAHELGPDGFDVWHDWSRNGKGYNEADARATWRSAKPGGNGKGAITIASLIAKVTPFGFKLNKDDRQPISQDEIDRRQRERDEREAAAKAEFERRRANAALQAAAIWDGAEDIDGDEHPYLARKGVRSFGLRVGEYRGHRNSLLLPLRLIDGTLTSLQAIFENASPMMDGRDRDYLPGGQKMGAFHMIGGKPSGHEPVILVGSGYATCASAHMATGHCTAVAFDDSSLRAVAVALRNVYPAALIVILADDDCWHDDPKKPNSGRVNGGQAAQAAAGMLAIPQFADVTGKPTDFNDLHQLEGLDAVRAQIEAVMPRKAANDNTPAYSLDAPINYNGYPHVSDKGQPLNTVENLEYMLGQYGITARYNQIRKAVEVVLPGRTYTLDNKANCSLAELTSIAVRNRMPQSNMADYIKLIADRNAYNPVCDWITSRPWDGVTRIQQLLDTVRTDGDAALKDKLMYRWLLSAVASVFQPVGFEGHGCLVFTGPQGVGKTTWFRRLVPNELRLVLVGAMLDPADKDSVTNAVSHWIVELGELDATFRKADIARLKSFIPKPDDKLRRPYDRVDSEYQRRTVFCASVNDDKYLVDDTGNRRWWTVPVSTIDFRHQIDMQQLWAELLLRFQAGEQYHLTPEENAALGDLNAEHEAVDPVEEMISAAFDWDKPSLNKHEMTASDVLVAIGFDKPNKAQATHASKVLKKLTGGDPIKRAKGRFFPMPSAPRGRRSAPVSTGDDDARPF